MSGSAVRERKARDSLKSALSAGAQRERKHELVKTTWHSPTLDGAGFYTLSAAPTCRFYISAAPTLERGHAINIKAGVWRDFRRAQGHRSSLTSCKFDKTFLRNAWARSKPRIGYLQRRGCLAVHELEESTHGIAIWLKVISVQMTVTWTLLKRSQSLHEVEKMQRICRILHLNSCFVCLFEWRDPIVIKTQLGLPKGMIFSCFISPLSALNEKKVKPKSITFDEQCLVWLPYLSLCRAL